MSRSAAPNRHANRLLAALSAAEFGQLRPQLRTIELASRTVLVEVGDRIRYLYFPHSAVICLTAASKHYLRWGSGRKAPCNGTRPSTTSAVTADNQARGRTAWQRKNRGSNLLAQ